MILNIKYLGHSCFLIESKGFKLLFDPFIKGNPIAQEVDIKTLNPDYIFITHGHGDHIGDTIEIAKLSGAKIISSYEVCNWLSSNDFEMFGLNIGGKIKLDFGFVKMVAANHSSSMPDGTYGANPGGFVIWNDELSFYISGDTSLIWDMKLIPLTVPQLDFAILCIGDLFTMGFEDAALAAEFIQCKNIIGCHFDTFAPIRINHQNAIDYFHSKNLKLILPKINQIINTFS